MSRSLDAAPLRALVLGLLSAALAGPLAARADGSLAPAALRHVPVDLSLVPPLSLNGDGPALNHLSLGLAAARSTSLRGLALAPLHWADEDVSGAQLTWIAASARGTVRGLQLAQLANVAGVLRGAQATSVVNVVRGGGRGVQLASVLNVSRRDLAGAQLAAVANLAGEVRGAQLSLVNVAGDVAGAQVGLVNVARRVSGAQVGLVNVSREADAAVGIVSLVQGGRREAELFATELSLANVALRLGGSRVHGVLVAGIQPEERPGAGATRWTWGAGVGGGFRLPGPLSLELDLLAQAVQYDRAEPEAALGTARALLAWRAHPRLSAFAGPTLNLLVAGRPRPDVELGRDLRSGGREARLWAGFAAGIRL